MASAELDGESFYDLLRKLEEVHFREVAELQGQLKSAPERPALGPKLENPLPLELPPDHEAPVRPRVPRGDVLEVSADTSREFQRLSMLSPPKQQQQKPKTFWACFEFWVRSERFDIFIAFLVFANFITMAAEVQYEGMDVGYSLGHRFMTIPSSEYWPGAPAVFQVCGTFFLVVFSMEILVRLLFLRAAFCKTCYNIVDFLALLASVVELWRSLPVDPTLLRLCRLAKLFRTIRFLKMSGMLDSLSMLLRCMSSSGLTLFWSLLFLGVIQLIAAMIICLLVRPYLEDVQVNEVERLAVYRYYGSFTLAVLTLFEVFFANWSPACRALTDNISEWYMTLFLIYRCAIGFAVINVVNAVFVQQTLQVAKGDEEMLFLEKQKAEEKYFRSVAGMFHKLDTSGDGSLSWEEFQQAMEDPKLCFLLQKLEIDPGDLKLLFDLMDEQGTGEISIEDFIEGITRFKGGAKSLDVGQVLLRAKRLEKSLARIEDRLAPPPPRLGAARKAAAQRDLVLGVRLEMDFDQFFQREDAGQQLGRWREAIATKVLGVSPWQLQLQRVRRGSLDLEFVVEGSGISDEELRRRLSREADRLRALFQEPVMEVRVGADQRPGLPAGLHNAEPAPSPARQRALQERSQAEREYGLTPELHQDTWLQERIRASEREYGLDLPLEQRCALADAGARRLLERHSPSRPQSAAPAPPARRMPSLNHPTAPEGPRFLMKDSYWEQRQGERIREQREALHRRGVLRDEEEVKVPAFKAKPVPATVYTPRLQAIRIMSTKRLWCDLTKLGAARSKHLMTMVSMAENDTERGPFRAGAQKLGLLVRAMTNGVYGLLGDSSLFCKKSNGKKAELKGSLSWKLPGDLHLQYRGGGGVREILQMLKRSDGFQVLGVSYFGNEHVTKQMDIRIYKPLWEELFQEIRRKCGRAVFFMGGYSQRYGYGQVYDDNMGTIREWIADAGLGVRTDFEKVRDWPLGDALHFAASVKDDVVNYLADLLLTAPPIKGATCGYKKPQQPPSAATSPATAGGRRWGRRAAAKPDFRPASGLYKQVRKWDPFVEEYFTAHVEIPLEQVEIAAEVAEKFAEGQFGDILANLEGVKHAMGAEGLTSMGRFILHRELCMKCVAKESPAPAEAEKAFATQLGRARIDC
ncbi:unnamed protein product [Effrenium voratum]|nr:unnamed protein product [Effrenium voratum]